MKRPGKRDRLRKTAQDSDWTPAAESSEPAAQPAPEPSAATSQTATRREGPSPEERRAIRQLTAAVGAAAVMCAALIAGLSQILPSKGSRGSEPFSYPDMVPDEDRPTQPTPPPDLRLVQGGPVPEPDPVLPGNGYPLFLRALAALPKADGPTRRALSALDRDPRSVNLGDVGQAHLKASHPALELLRQAACSATLTRTPPAEGDPAFDLLTRRQLALSALAFGRMHSKGGAPAEGARWALYVIRLGHAQAAEGPLLEVTTGVALARLGEEWIQTSLATYRWSDPELEWLVERLDALQGERPAQAAVTDADTLPAERREKALEGKDRVFVAEGRRLTALLAICRSKRSKKGETE